MSYLSLDLLPLLPKLPGVYLFFGSDDKVIYIGKAVNLSNRVRSYFQNQDKLLPKTALLAQEITKVNYILTESEIDAFLLEANLVRKYRPKYNFTGKDDKRFPLIEISLKEAVPLVKIVRRETDKNKLYFGPYPPGTDLYKLLRQLRSVFPFMSQKHKNGEVCLRGHLGLCPCQNIAKRKTQNAKPSSNLKTISQYQKTIKQLVGFLSGERTTIQKQLEKEMREAAKKQEYEKAAEIKEKLEKLQCLTAVRRNPWEYEENPNLVADKREQELKELSRNLGGLSIRRIEAYDVANISGMFATGAMATFIDGEPEKSLYRRYKIKRKGQPDDCATLAEITARRLKSEIPLPDLMVIDGGVGQVNAALSVIARRETTKQPPDDKVRVISLAKKLETIYTDDGRVIQLPKDSPALHLLQRLRDEAHRFAQKYHFYLRSKSCFQG